MAERKKHKQQPDPETTRPANDTVGEMLRAAREAKKLELETVSQSIHIRAAQLKAIEDNNIESLPGMTYAVGFVRSYANFLGLNGAEIVHRFKAEHGHTPPANSKLSFPEPIAESRVPDPMMVGVGAFLAVVILVLWTIYSNVHGSSKVADKVPPAPVVTSVADTLPTTTTTPATAPTTEQLAGATTTPAPATTAAAPTATEAAQPAVPAPIAATAPTTEQQPTAAAAPIPAATAPTVAATPPAQTASATTPAATPAKEAAASDDADSEDDSADDEDAPKKSADDSKVIKIKHGKSRITLKATEASWVQVSDAHENVLYRKVLRPGEQYAVPDQPGLHLDTANAGGLQVIVDGHRAPALGKDGDIMRGIPLDPQELR